MAVRSWGRVECSAVDVSRGFVRQAKPATQIDSGTSSSVSIVSKNDSLLSLSTKSLHTTVVYSHVQVFHSRLISIAAPRSSLPSFSSSVPLISVHGDPLHVKVRQRQRVWSSTLLTDNRRALERRANGASAECGQAVESEGLQFPGTRTFPLVFPAPRTILYNSATRPPSIKYVAFAREHCNVVLPEISLCLLLLGTVCPTNSILLGGPSPRYGLVHFGLCRKRDATNERIFIENHPSIQF